MAKLLPILLLLIGLGGGIGAGIALAPAPEEPAQGEDHAAEGHEGDHDDDQHEEAAYDDHGEEKEPNSFIKISNQFVVPVVERDKLVAMVVLSFSLETKPGLEERVHNFEPKLRDSFLQVLFDHANMGGFQGSFTRSEVLDPLRTALREEAQRYLGKDLIDVLILEITRQDV